MVKGYLSLVLHAHLPYVRHPEYDSFLEERWFFEALTGTYIPLIKVLRQLISEQVPFEITLSISPTLLSMLEDTTLQERYAHHLEKLIVLAEKEQNRNHHDGHLSWLASFYKDSFTETLQIFNSYDGKLSKAFLELHQSAQVKLITTSATHAVLPLYMSEPGAVKVQISTGISTFESVLGFRPQGFWLPECAYIPGIEDILRQEGIRYFFLESHGIDHADVVPLYGIYAPLFTPSGVAAFARDQDSTEEVWSAQKGFPGDPLYREFYRDIGHELDMDYIAPYIEDNVRVDTGIKYWKITGPGSHKGYYNPYRARERAADHAAIYMNKRIAQINQLSSVMSKEPVIVATFDAELFGHWWYEGPQWLDYLIRKTAFDQSTMAMLSPQSYLNRHPVHQHGMPCMSSWGHRGYFEVWCNGKTDWILTHLNECIRRMKCLAEKYSTVPQESKITKALNQCVRELLLAQSSDWPFMITNSTSEQYASRRVRDHISRFHFLADYIESNQSNSNMVETLEHLDSIFPNADFRMYSK
ncbi:Glycogen branching enzyme, GH57 family [Chitinispirillum alkaliphilum]|nr:Glycogen branching enzyme, GH57 family [Chitinispirillum alkaliphilum]